MNLAKHTENKMEKIIITFFHFGRNLKQAIHAFGTTIYEAKVKRFYHGITEQLVFPNYMYQADGVRIFAPLSTSSELAVALNFTQYGQGMVVTFGDDNRRVFSPKYFSCAWISDYSNEREYLF
eukprot:951161_1